MKYAFILISLLTLNLLHAQEENLWSVNLGEASEIAAESDKPILISFSGSDWCASCMRLEKDLFESEDFISYATEALVLVNLDFPAKKINRLSDEQTEQNEKLAEKYNKKGLFPYTLIVDAKGKVLGKMKYPCTSVEEYIQSIQLITNE